MTYDARSISNWFIRRARADGRELSIMSLLKLTYIAHGWHLEIRKRPLFSNKIQAWQFGPVIPDVYNTLRPQGVTVLSEASGFDDPISEADEILLGQIWDIYGSMSAYQLSDITHEKGGPWEIATESGGNYAPIPDDATSFADSIAERCSSNVASE